MSYIRDRMIQALITVYGIVTLTFLLTKLMPGGPLQFLMRDVGENPEKYGLPPNPSQEQINDVIETYIVVPPDKPIHEAYVDYMYSVFINFNFGESVIVYPRVPVLDIVLIRAPWTIFLSTIALLYGLIIGIILGSLMAYYEGSKFDLGMTLSMIFSNAVPYYVVAIALLYFLSFQLGYFPTGGRFDPDTTPGINWPYISSVFYHAALPSLSFILTGFGGHALGLRANSIRLVGSEYIRNAELRGISQYTIATSYLARNAILPIWTGVVVALGSLLGGSVVLEQIYQYPGMGMLLFEAAIMRDFPLLMGGFVLTAFLFVIGTIIADFTYALIDPRADVKESR